MRAVLQSLAASAALIWAGCNVNEYPLCIGCPDASAWDSATAVDSSAVDAPVVPIVDAMPADACPQGEVELCDGMDNDCDGAMDEGPIAGVDRSCSSNVGECSAGLTRCVSGELVCSGAMPADELCDGLDNDCDGTPDEGLPTMGSCGTLDVGECRLGELRCIGGIDQCVGEVRPAIEQCDALDHDCDGAALNGFDLMSDSRNCGTCGNVCAATNAVTQCNGMGACVLVVCQPGYWDLANGYADGCEYQCTYQGPQEACNQRDDDCDGTVDEALVPPDLCLSQGACGADGPVQPTCTADGWRCLYGTDVQVDDTGTITNETRCDDIDNDCDGAVDESHPLKNTACDDGAPGICQATGTFICNEQDPTGPVVCDIDTPGQPGSAESCNGADDDCDGRVDEGDIYSWVNVGGGVQMFAYEASRPDATELTGGAVATRACSDPGVLPWTSITRPAAEAACAASGARLCTELEWQRACKVLAPPLGPVSQGGAPDYLAFVEAEDAVANVPQGSHSWILDNARDYSGAAALRALPNTGARYDTTYVTNSPRLDYRIDFQRTGTHYVWVLGWGATTSDDSCHVGLNGAAVASAEQITGFADSWGWSSSTISGVVATLDVASTGVHTVNVWMREDGFRVDALLITANPSFIPGQDNRSGNGCQWSYSTSCTSYDGARCNGQDHDTDPLADGNQDQMTSTGQLAGCYANWGASGRIYDLSGNVKEWTAPRSPGVNPLRGGSFTNAADGLSCDHDFTVADDTFVFPNVGFRCCR